ncbi:uncharacterized protein [Garra rufa]|uniref:uncharacterized protein n=1 Tax=Garra rufa TaxID=137080 RepID=UPI003CCEC739
MLEDVDEGEDEEDEGFREDQTFDITESSLTDDPSFSLSSTQPDASFTPGASASPDESVALDSAGVLDKVDSLAEYLELRNQPSLGLTNHQENSNFTVLIMLFISGFSPRLWIVLVCWTKVDSLVEYLVELRELLGVDYFLSQTGQPLVVDPDSEETENMLEDVDEGEDEEDEGFREDQTLDITVSSLTDDPSFSLSSTVPPSRQVPQHLLTSLWLWIVLVCWTKWTALWSILWSSGISHLWLSPTSRWAI